MVLDSSRNISLRGMSSRQGIKSTMARNLRNFFEGVGRLGVGSKFSFVQFKDDAQMSHWEGKLNVPKGQLQVALITALVSLQFVRMFQQWVAANKLMFDVGM